MCKFEWRKGVEANEENDDDDDQQQATNVRGEGRRTAAAATAAPPEAASGGDDNPNKTTRDRMQQVAVSALALPFPLLAQPPPPPPPLWQPYEFSSLACCHSRYSPSTAANYSPVALSLFATVCKIDSQSAQLNAPDRAGRADSHR